MGRKEERGEGSRGEWREGKEFWRVNGKERRGEGMERGEGRGRELEGGKVREERRQ